MHLRFSTHRSGDTVRRYAQLVESYRRDDGMPAHRVVASLGQLTDLEVDNLRAALAASRAGQAVVLQSEASLKGDVSPVAQPLGYLDVAVGLATWERLRLDALLQHIGTPAADQVPASKVIAALALQRCLEPDSKLAAVDWFAKTALPELLDVAPSAFNNSRIHRVLEQLEAGDDALQAALGQHYADLGRPTNTLFLDVTDTWFEGHGPDLAARGRTKEGMRNRRRVGLVLLCNDAGFPLRWKVLGGREREADAMKAMVSEVAALPWVADAPLVCDRAMGQAGAISHLAASGVRFVTAAYRTEITSWTTMESLPTAAFEAFEVPDDVFELDDDDPIPDAVLKQVRALATTEGFEHVADDLFVRDLGVVQRNLTRRSTSVAEIDTAGQDVGDADATEQAGDDLPEVGNDATQLRTRIPKQTTSPASDWLRRARGYQARLDAGEFRSRAHLAAAEGMSRARVTQIFSILQLDPALQTALLANAYGPVPVGPLRDIAVLTREQQRRLLESIGEQNAAHGKHTEVYVPTRKALLKRKAAAAASSAASAGMSFRLVVAFNPVLFVDQRRTAMRQRQKFEARLADLNRRIAGSAAARTEAEVFAQATALLQAAGLKSAYTLAVQLLPAVEGQPERVISVTASLRNDVWARRRRYDGLVLLVAHAAIPTSARDIVKLYRDKDAVEKDFQTIKSVIKLRPVYHRTDAKLRAHVTVCMLALLVERAIERRLAETGAPVRTAPALFAHLHQAQLERLPKGRRGIAYRLAPLQPLQSKLLQKLDLAPLAEPEEIARRITPRTTAA